MGHVLIINGTFLALQAKGRAPTEEARVFSIKTSASKNPSRV